MLEVSAFYSVSITSEVSEESSRRNILGLECLVAGFHLRSSRSSLFYDEFMLQMCGSHGPVFLRLQGQIFRARICLKRKVV